MGEGVSEWGYRRPHLSWMKNDAVVAALMQMEEGRWEFEINNRNESNDFMQNA